MTSRGLGPKQKRPTLSMRGTKQPDSSSEEGIEWGAVFLKELANILSQNDYFEITQSPIHPLPADTKNIIRGGSYQLTARLKQTGTLLCSIFADDNKPGSVYITGILGQGTLSHTFDYPLQRDCRDFLKRCHDRLLNQPEEIFGIKSRLIKR